MILTLVPGGTGIHVSKEEVSTAPLRQLIDQDGRPKKELGRRYAERYGILEASGARLIERVFTQKSVSYWTADNICCLFGVVGLMEEAS